MKAEEYVHCSVCERCHIRALTACTQEHAWTVLGLFISGGEARRHAYAKNLPMRGYEQ